MCVCSAALVSAATPLVHAQTRDAAPAERASGNGRRSERFAAPAARAAAPAMEPAGSIEPGSDEPTAEPGSDEPPRRRGANAPPVQMERVSKLGISPLYTFLGLGVTAGLGAVMVWSLVDTLEARDRYEANPTMAGDEQRQDKVRRTWILGAAASAAAIGTLLVALLGTDWSSDDADDGEARLTPLVGPDGGGLSLSGTF